jgi:uncharacterized protein HemX
MPIYLISNVKLLLANEDKTKNIAIEYPKELTLQELLDRIKEFEDAILKSMEAEKNKATEEKVVEVTPEVQA